MTDWRRGDVLRHPRFREGVTAWVSEVGETVGHGDHPGLLVADLVFPTGGDGTRVFGWHLDDDCERVGHADTWAEFAGPAEKAWRAAKRRRKAAERKRGQAK